MNNTLFIVKLGYAGVYLFFSCLVQNIDCGYSLEQLSGDLCFEEKILKISIFPGEILNFYMSKNVCVLHG